MDDFNSAEVRARQKSFILEFVKLGMDWHRAAIASECTLSDIEELEHDEDFQKEINFAVSIKIRDLLQDLNRTAQNAARLKGDTRGLERILELLDPEQYSKVTRLSHSLGKGKGAPKTGLKIEFVGTENAE